MSRLLDILRSAGRTLNDGLGSWRVQITRAVDDLVAAGGGSLAGAQYLQAGTNANANVQLNTDLVLNTIVAQQGIAYNVATGVATLTAGKMYSLRASGEIVNFVGGAPPFFDITWVDAATNVALQAAITGTWIPVSDTSTSAPSDAVEVVYKPSTNQNVKLRTVGGGGGSALAAAGHFWSVIQQIA